MEPMQNAYADDRPGFVARNRGALFVGAVVLLLIASQMPAVKGVLYRVFGATPPADGIAWRTDFTAALEESKRTGKPVLLDFTADWCPPCRAMKQDVWPDDRVREVVAGEYIPVLLNIDLPANREPAERYNVRSIPSIVVVDHNGSVLRRGSSMSRDQMVTFLTTRRAGYGARGPLTAAGDLR